MNRSIIVEILKSSTAKQFVFVMVGLPGSGKTTFIKDYLDGLIRVNHDEIYKMVSGCYRPELRSLYHSIENFIITQALIDGHSVVVDRTCTDTATRKRFVELARLYHVEPVAVIMDTPIEKCRSWNDLRDEDEHVPEFVIEKMHENFQEVRPDENFSNVLVVHPDRQVDFYGLGDKWMILP